MNITDELNSIIFKYELDRYFPHYRKMIGAKAILEQIVESCISKKEKTIFVGNDKAVFQLIKRMSRYSDIEMFEILEEEDLKQKDWSFYKNIYLISFFEKEKQAYWFRSRGIQCNELYDVLEGHGIILEHPMGSFHVEKHSKWFDGLFLGKQKGDNLTMELFFKQIRLRSTEDVTLNRIATEKCLFLALCMKNFICAEEYFDLLKDDERIANARKEINELLVKIKKSVLKNEHIIMYWMDAIQYGMEENMPYLKSMMEKSVSFENAFACSHHTSPTLKTIFCEKTLIEDKSYEIKRIDQENSPLLCFLNTQGYEVNVLTGYETFLDDYGLPGQGYDIDTPFSSILWELLQLLITSNKKGFFLVHALVEGHSPHLSTKMAEKDVFENSTEDRKKLAREELDRQLSFYDNFLCGEECRIYMSDHGSGNHADIMHIHMNIYKKNIIAKKIKGMFAVRDFRKIIEQIILEGNIDESKLCCEYVKIDDVDHYNRQIIEEVLKKGKRLTNYQFGFRGIVTEEYIYMKFSTGKKWLLKREDKMRIGNVMSEYVCDETLLPLYEHMAGEYPKELILEKKFRHTKYLHTYLQEWREKMSNRVFAICKLLDKYPDYSVYLRMGGMHSYELYVSLPEVAKKKIGGIIDNNKECVCSCFRLPIVSRERIENCNISAVVLSSYVYREQLEEEAKKYPSTIDIISLYAEMEKLGIHCNKEFYVFDIPAEVGKRLGSLMDEEE